MAVTNVVISVAKNRLEGSFSTDGVALPATTGTIGTPAAPTASNVVTVPSNADLFAGDVIKYDGIGPSGVPVICGIDSIPGASTIGLQGTRISTAVTGQPITKLPYLNIKHNAKRVMLRNLTSGDSWEWNQTMKLGSALKHAAGGAQSYTATDGFYVRGAIIYLHPAIYAINSEYSFSVDY